MILALLILVMLFLAIVTVVVFSLPWLQDDIEAWIDRWQER